jgi:YD repeat-containing protein
MHQALHGYDDFNRLISNFNNGHQAFSWTYDRWGNR